MAPFAARLAKVLHILVGVILATTASAAPNGEVSPSQDCFSKAALQRTLDHAQCTALPLPMRNQCIVQAEQTYASATAACATKGSGKRTVTPKQNTDAPFTRRLRF